MECIGYAAFGSVDGKRIPLISYTGADEQSVKRKVLTAAKKEGFNGTADERMKQLEWWIEPIYAIAQNKNGK